MRSKSFALAALVLTASLGAALGQTNAPSVNTAPTATTTPSGPGAATVSPSGPETQNPTINPSAAGTQRGWRGYGSSAVTPSGRDRDGGETTGSKPIDANTHPLTALRTGKRSTRQHQPTGVGGSARPQQ